MQTIPLPREKSFARVFRRRMKYTHTRTMREKKKIERKVENVC